MIDKLVALIEALKTIKMRQALQWALMCVFAVVVLNVYETRATAVPLLLSNTALLLLLAGSSVLGIVSWLGSKLMDRIDERSGEVVRMLHAEIQALQTQLLEARAAERLSRIEVVDLKMRVTKAEVILRQHGLTLDNSK